MNSSLRSLLTVAMLGALGAVDAADQAAAQANQSTDAAVASARDVASGTAAGKRQYPKVTVKIGKIEDIDGDGVASARALSPSAAQSSPPHQSKEEK